MSPMWLAVDLRRPRWRAYSFLRLSMYLLGLTQLSEVGMDLGQCMMHGDV